MVKRILWIGIFFIFSSQLIGQEIFGYRFERDNQNKIVIPFELVNNLVVVPVRVNGLKLKFIVDTGVKYTILVDKLYSDLLEIEYQRTIQLMGADRNQLMTAYVAPNVNLNVSGVFNPKETLLILEKDFLEFERIFGTDVQGIIGFELFRSFVVKIDYDKKRITLYKPENFEKKKIYKRHYKPYPIDLIYSKPYITAPITLENGDSVHGKFLIDSGASFDLLIDVNSDDKVGFPSKTMRGDLGRGLGGVLDGVIGRVDKLDFSPFGFDDVITFYQDDDIFDEIVEVSKRNGIIGAGILSRFTVILDYHNKQMWLSKSKKYKEPFAFNMSGIILRDGDNQAKYFTVKEVLPDTPGAEAGIQAGDKIYFVNGIRGNRLTRVIIKNIFKEKEGKKISIRVLRGEEKIRAKFKLRELI